MEGGRGLSAHRDMRLMNEKLNFEVNPALPVIVLSDDTRMTYMIHPRRAVQVQSRERF